MKILVTSAKSNISKKIIMDLKKNHDVISTDVSGQNNHNFVQCQLDELHDTDLLLKDVDIIINIGYDGQSASDKILIDYYTRCIYNLLWSASENGVSRVINISTLKLFETCYENLAITENWSTHPISSDVNILCAYLCEMVHKEFPRDKKIKVTNIRIGFGDSNSTSFLSDGDLLKYLELIINYKQQIKKTPYQVPPQYWETIHIQSKVPNQRFITKKFDSIFDQFRKNKNKE